ncbi:thioredoxin family protein [Glycomyces terrestris]|uniref:Thioredoxin family protein n=1 Tax=Glycomyces terrestris TaxID=2493553 RepID=A0A426UXV7_9ACTN|nr:thioredoxin family protein [Glycomyces terrestris]RRR99407.1 thioredoxin family protein [Glycomyces terrestris]
MTAMTLLTEPRSDRCDRAREALLRLSAEFDVVVTEIDLTGREGRGLAVQHAVSAAPGLLVDGVLYSCGELDAARLRSTLASVRPIGG